MLGRRAKILSAPDVNDLLVFASCTRQPLRNTVMVLLSAKAGLRAGEIANLTWDMVVDANGQISGLIELADSAAKKCSGRSIPVHPDLAAALAALRQAFPSSKHVISSERGGRMRPLSIVVWFNRAFKTLASKVFVAFRPPNVRHPGRSHRSQGGRLAAGRATAGRPPVDPDDATVHRRRQRRATQTGRDDLRTMVATTTIRHRQTKRQNHPKIHKPTSAAIDHAVRLIHAVCGLAGSATWIDDIRTDLRADKATWGAISLSSSSHFAAMLYSHTRNPVAIAARPRQAVDVAGADRVGDSRKHNRNGAGRLRQRCKSGAGIRQDDVRREGQQFRHVLAIAVGIACGPARVDAHVAAFCPT